MNFMNIITLHFMPNVGIFTNCEVMTILLMIVGSGLTTLPFAT